MNLPVGLYDDVERVLGLTELDFFELDLLFIPGNNPVGSSFSLLGSSIIFPNPSILVFNFFFTCSLTYVGTQCPHDTNMVLG